MDGKVRLVLVALTSVLAALSGGATTVAAPVGSAVSHASPLDDLEEECLEPVPATAGHSSVTDDGQAVKLEVWVLIDDLSKQRAEEVMKGAAKAYSPLNIELRAAGYQRIRIKGGPPRKGRGTANNVALFAQMKEEMGGTRPEGSDAVHLLTGKDAYTKDGRNYSLGGEADCIGGVRYPDRAFSFSEGAGEYQEGDRDMSGIIAAHEIGHLMGAHHHYGNCGQGSPLMQENETPCTIMFPFLHAWNAGNFGTLEGSVVRGHAVDFASP